MHPGPVPSALIRYTLKRSPRMGSAMVPLGPRLCKVRFRSERALGSRETRGAARGVRSSAVRHLGTLRLDWRLKQTLEREFSLAVSNVHAFSPHRLRLAGRICQ